MAKKPTLWKLGGGIGNRIRRMEGVVAWGFCLSPSLYLITG
jgi:hypothetical protein